MTQNVISVEHLTKQYDLGVIGTGTLTRDLNRWWARLRRKPDPYALIGKDDSFSQIGESILALDDVSFTVQRGETLGIIGSNGAGKSTLLKILSRVTAPTSGVVRVKGRIGSLLEVGTGFHPELTGRENIFLNGAILGMKKAEVSRKFDEIVDFSGVEKFIDTPVKRYSSGMYVRLAFAVAAHLDPEILIVDEVLAVGDAEFQKKCIGKMGDVAGEGRTVLFVSHNMGAIKQICNKGIALEKGAFLFQGSAENTIHRYIGIHSSNKEGKITDHQIIKDPDLEISSVFVNDQLNDFLELKNHDEQITIKICGHNRRTMNLEIEFRLLDQFDNVLAFFSPGHVRGSVKRFAAGDFIIERKAKLPKGINKGIYFLSIYLTDPSIAGWADMEKAVEIHHEGVITDTGRTFEQNSKDGWLLLEEQD
ncbi:ABC transporter ATP-binding protein [Chloroflexota bacterium]